MTIGGALTLSALEPLSKEKMWFKKVELPQTVRTIAIETEGGDKGLESVNNALANACDEVLVAFFNSSMPQISRYFSADEMASLKRQSQELRQKKTY